MSSWTEEKALMSPHRRAAHEVCDARWSTKAEGLALLTCWVFSLTKAWSYEEQATEHAKAIAYLMDMCPETFDPQNPSFDR